MPFKLLKRTSAYETLKKDIASKSLSHAYLIVSEDGLARREFLKLASLMIICSRGCGECAACKRVLNGVHADIKTYDGNEIAVRDINELVEDTQIRSTEGGKKLYMIDNAEGLTVAVQNKLLKTYEEPGEDIIIFLAVKNENVILPTIKSRARKLFIPPFPAADITRLLIDKGLDGGEAEAAAAYAQGSLEKADRMSGEQSYKESFSAVLELLAGLRNSRQLAEYIFLPLLNKDNLPVTLDFMEIILSDVLILSAGAEVQLKTVRRDYDLRQIKRDFSPAGAAAALLAIAEGRKMIYYNINATSVAEKILFDILEARYKWQ